MLKNGITVVVAPPTKREKQPVISMMRGLAKIGLSVKTVASRHSLMPTKQVAVWGWRNCARLRARGHDILVLERGYVGDRYSYTSLCWNGLNGHGTFPACPDDGGARFASHGGVLQPWKTGGDYALILGQVPGDMSLQGRDMLPWYEDAAAQISKIHGLPVHFREHPVAIQKNRRITVPGTVKSEVSLDAALAGAAFTVCFNSNAAVDSVLAGVPCISGDKGTMAWEMCGHDFGEIVRPDREVWASKLAWTQWTDAEIASGAALKGLFAA